MKDQIYWRKNVIVQELKIRKADVFIQIVADEMRKRNVWSELEHRLDILLANNGPHVGFFNEIKDKMKVYMSFIL